MFAVVVSCYHGKLFEEDVAVQPRNGFDKVLLTYE